MSSTHMMANLNFDDLQGHTSVIKCVENLSVSIDSIATLASTLMQIKKKEYANLELKDKINYDLFLSYTLNTLYWMYLRTRGDDPNESDVKKELTRIKEYMVTAKRVRDRFSIRPKIDQATAKRFIKHNIPNSKRPKLND